MNLILSIQVVCCILVLDKSGDLVAIFTKYFPVATKNAVSVFS